MSNLDVILLILRYNIKYNQYIVNNILNTLSLLQHTVKIVTDVIVNTEDINIHESCLKNISRKLDFVNDCMDYIVSRIRRHSNLKSTYESSFARIKKSVAKCGMILNSKNAHVEKLMEIFTSKANQFGPHPPYHDTKSSFKSININIVKSNSDQV